MNYKAIPGFDSYLIDQYGNVKSKLTGKILKPGFMTSGYKFLILRKNGQSFNRSIHRLVALTFLENPFNKPQVNHINGIKTDNRVENLEWSTRSENIKHMYDTGLKKYKPLHYKGKTGANHNRSLKVLCKNNGCAYGSFAEAERILNLSYGSVSRSIKNNKPINGLLFEKQ